MLTFLLTLMAGAEAPQVRAGLEPLGFLVGHCWRADFERPGEQDTQCFEPVFDGQHIRSRHEVTGAKEKYRGETLFSFDGKLVTFTYWNSIGGVSRGTMTAAPDRLSFGDESYTGADGKRITFSTTWRKIADDAFEAVTVSPEAPAMNRTLRYRKVGAAGSDQAKLPR